MNVYHWREINTPSPHLAIGPAIKLTMPFDPPELKTKILEAARILDEHVYLPDLFQSVLSGEDDPADETLSPDTTIEFSASGWDTNIETSIEGLIALAGLIRDNVRVNKRESLRLKDRTIIYVEAIGSEEQKFVRNIGESSLNVGVTVDGSLFQIELTRECVEFSTLIEVEGENNEYYPSLNDHTTFVEVTHPETASDEVVRGIALSFLFELGTLGYCFSPASFPTVEDYSEEDEDDQDTNDPRIRPLQVGLGLIDLHSLFVAGSCSSPAEYALIHFVKVIEYVSATVVRLARHEAIRKRLSTRESLAPNAAFLDGLVQTIEEYRSFNKDSEALKLTLNTCCDPRLLADDAPSYLGQLRQLRTDDEPKRYKAALDELAAALSATRNQLSHAKANYILTGAECPPDELGDLVSCARRAAEQVIRWYANLPPNSRVV